jgi:hypothetical protein
MAGLVLSLLASRQAGAQTATDPQPALESAAALARPTAQVPPASSPVSFFRELLAMTPGERRQALTNKPRENQQGILAKVEEYAALPPEDRELRLRATELRWYLVPLLSASATNRTAALSQIPADMRKFVEDRLEQWQILPPPLKERILEDDQNMQSYLQLVGGGPRQQQELIKIYPPGLREKLEVEIRQVNSFFELAPEEKAKVLAIISEPERRQMEATLRAFEKLPDEQRAQCIRAFSTFTKLSAAGQQQFFRNAERWQAMTPAERQRWRELVRDVPQWPPLPAGMAASPPPATSVSRVSVATNRN